MAVATNAFNITLAIDMTNGGDYEELDGSGQFNQNAQGKWGGDLNVAPVVSGFALLPSTWNMQPSATCATTGALPANTYSNGTAGVGATLTGTTNGALATIDGHSPALGDTVLVQDEATPAHNGLYLVTQLGSGGQPYILTRVTTMDSTAKYVNSVLLVVNGTVNGGKLFSCTNVAAPTVGTTAITFAQATGGSVFAYGSVTTPGYMYLENLDTTNFVHYGPQFGGALIPMGKLKPGEADKIRIDPGVIMAALADTAALLVNYEVFQD